MKQIRDANTCTLKSDKEHKLQGVRHSSELGLRSMDFRAPESLIFPALEAYRDGAKLNYVHPPTVLSKIFGRSV